MRHLILTGLLAVPALAQTPLPSPPRDAGTYHVASGNWTRAGSGQPQLGPDVIYNASKPSGYFAVGWEGIEAVDEGILPGTTNPNFNGSQDAYRIDGFQFAYCSLAGSVDWTFHFYDSYLPCDEPSNPVGCINKVGQVVLPGMPAGAACWTVTIDLSGGSKLCMLAEGGPCAPGYQGPASDLDHFGWGATYVTDDGSLTGPLLAGADPNWAPEGEGTCYLPSLTCFAGPTANGARDQVAVDGLGCFNFGGYSNPLGCGFTGPVPFAQFYMVMFTDCSTSCRPTFGVYCDTDPDQLGYLCISTDRLADDPILLATHLAGGLFAYHLVGNGTGVVNDPPGALGQMCLGGSTPGIGRYNKDMGAVVNGSFSTDLIHGATGGGTGNLPNPPGGSLLPGQTWNFQTWVRIAGSSRFTPAITVTFQ